MFYLIYISAAARAMSEDELAQLLEQSRAKNERLGITGLLLYQGGNFMQMLEGKQQTVQNLFDTIRHDKRHWAVITIITGQTDARNFENWSMGFCNMDRPGDYLRYETFLRKNLILKEFQEGAEHAYDFMRMFSETS